MCSVVTCENKVLAKGLCNKHYLRLQRYGDVEHTHFIRDDNLARFWSYVNKTKTCWLWTGRARGKGYGAFRLPTGSASAHRYAYELIKGPIPARMQLDHTCMVKLCVNPDHLEPVTNAENQYRAHDVRGAWPIEMRQPREISCVVCETKVMAIQYERRKYCSVACASRAARARRE